MRTMVLHNVARGHVGTQGSARPAQPAGRRKRNRLVTRSIAEEIDPSTGGYIFVMCTFTELASSIAIKKICSDTQAGSFISSVNAIASCKGGISWSYRKATASDDSTQLPVLLLHGIGSNSYSYRNLMQLLGDQGFTCYAPDWPGSGASDKPSPSSFGYDANAYSKGLDQFMEAIGETGPTNLIVHGFVLGQYGLLWALKNAARVQNLVILNTPLGRNTKLRPELAAFKNPVPFLRPKADSKFAADLFNASGLAYEIDYNDAQAYDVPYQQEAAANVALHSIMERMDWRQLLETVDEGFQGWRKPTIILYGNRDPFLDVTGAMGFLDDKRTNMKLIATNRMLGHMPQEDFADAFSDKVSTFFNGGEVS